MQRSCRPIDAVGDGHRQGPHHDPPALLNCAPRPGPSKTAAVSGLTMASPRPARTSSHTATAAGFARPGGAARRRPRSGRRSRGGRGRPAPGRSPARQSPFEGEPRFAASGWLAGSTATVGLSTGSTRTPGSGAAVSVRPRSGAARSSRRRARGPGRRDGDAQAGWPHGSHGTRQQQSAGRHRMLRRLSSSRPAFERCSITRPRPQSCLDLVKELPRPPWLESVGARARRAHSPAIAPAARGHGSASAARCAARGGAGDAAGRHRARKTRM